MTENSDVKIGGLLLAAGGSSRFGRPKQLFQFGGKSLLRRAAETLSVSVCDPVVVVLGAETHGSQAEVTDLPISICINENWKRGMSSSIRAGLKELLNYEPELSAVMITLCDQPHVTFEHIDLFTAEFRRSGTAILAAEYDGTVGVPALFAREHFDNLLELNGDKGARELIRQQGVEIVRMKIHGADFDIDTIDEARSKLG